METISGKKKVYYCKKYKLSMQIRGLVVGSKQKEYLDKYMDQAEKNHKLTEQVIQRKRKRDSDESKTAMNPAGPKSLRCRHLMPLQLVLWCWMERKGMRIMWISSFRNALELRVFNCQYVLNLYINTDVCCVIITICCGTSWLLCLTLHGYRSLGIFWTQCISSS